MRANVQMQYISSIISLFAKAADLLAKQAFFYLNRFGGIDFLLDCYDIEHTLPPDDTVEALQIVCVRNGGEVIGNNIAIKNMITKNVMMDILVGNLVSMWIEKSSRTKQQALSDMYGSHFFDCLMDEEIDLYKESDNYLFELFCEEMETGKMGSTL